MGKLRDTKRDVRYGRAGPAADLRKAEKKAAGKLKHTKHALFSADGGVAVGKEGAGAIAKKDKGPAKRAAVSGKGVKRSEGGEAVGKAAAETTGRKAAGLARLANAKGKPPPSAPRERKAIVARVLPLWEEIRDSKTVEETRLKLIEEVVTAVDETLAQVCGKHDAARVIQSCFKHGSEAQRETILAKVLAPLSLIELCRSHYGHKLVLAMLRRGSREHRKAICSQVAPHAGSLAVHRDGALVLDAAYAAAADKGTRLAMYRAMWGREFALFGETAAAGAESVRALVEAEAASAKGAADAQAAASRRASIIGALTELSLRAADKGTLFNALAQRATAEALLLSGGRNRTELAQAVIPAAVDILHSPAGALAAARALALVGAKERKVFCRALKGHVANAARELYGCAVLLALADVTDDTVLVAKTLIGELAADGEIFEIATHAHAHRLLLGLCQPPLPPSKRFETGNAGKKSFALGDTADFADEWLAKQLPPDLRPVAQARLELAAVASALGPLPAVAPPAVGAAAAALAGKAGKKGDTARADAAAAALSAIGDTEKAEAAGKKAPAGDLEIEVSKKPAHLRRRELRVAARGPLLEAIAADALRFVSDRCASIVAEAAMAALHPEHATPSGKGKAGGKDAPSSGKSDPWDLAADALVDAAFEPSALEGEAGEEAGRSAKKAKKEKGAKVAARTVPRYAVDANSGRVLKRLIQTDGVVGNAIATRVLAHLGALEAPSVPAAELVLHGGAWVWLALLEAPATAAAARKALKPVTAQLGEGKPPPGCAQLARALAAK